MYCSLIFIHPLYSDAYDDLNDEDAAVATDAYWELILKIGGDDFAAITDEDDSRMLLHWAAASRASKPMMQQIIKKHPPALKKGVANLLPLHLACMTNRLVAAESLAAAYPAALSMKDKDDKTPFEVIGDKIPFERIGAAPRVSMTDDEKLSFKRATLRAIIEAHYSNEAVLGYGTEKEVSIYIEYNFQ